MKQKIYLLIILSFYLSSTILSQNPEWMVYNTSNSEIPSNHINCITIDENNTKWIGTGEGLVKFDGITWEIYDTTNSELPSNWIFCIAIDKSDNKWIGTSEGLVKFDGITWIIYDTTNSELPANRIEEIAIDNDGNKWLGKIRSENLQLFGLVKFDDFTWTVYDTTNSDLPSNDVWCLSIDADNNKWIGTSNYFYGPLGGEGLVKYDDTTWTLYNKDNSELTSNSIVDIEIDESGSKWILVQGVLVKFDDVLWTFFPEMVEHHDDYWCLTTDIEGNKWIGLNGITGPADIGILKMYDTNWVSFSTSNSDLPNDHVRCISIDKYNNKWIGTSNWEYSGGLAVYNEGGVITDVQEQVVAKIIPQGYFLNQNYPNPFNPSTTIKYSIPFSVISNERSDVRNLNDSKISPSGRNDNAIVRLKIYDILGREVSTLVNQKQKPGNYEVTWDGLSASGGQVPSGVYFYQLTAGNFVETKKMILLR